MKKKAFKPVDPSPEVPHPVMTCKPTGHEQMLTEKFSESFEPSEVAVHSIVHWAVDIGRYKRSISANPDKRLHYNRLIAATVHQATTRFNEYSVERPEIAASIAKLISSIDWATIEPRITSEVPYSGCEPPSGFYFYDKIAGMPIQIVGSERINLPA